MNVSDQGSDSVGTTLPIGLTFDDQFVGGEQALGGQPQHVGFNPWPGRRLLRHSSRYRLEEGAYRSHVGILPPPPSANPGYSNPTANLQGRTQADDNISFAPSANKANCQSRANINRLRSWLDRKKLDDISFALGANEANCQPEADFSSICSRLDREKLKAESMDLTRPGAATTVGRRRTTTRPQRRSRPAASR